MNVLTKTVGFSVALMLVFTFVSYVLPQMKGEAPEEKEELDVGALTMDSFIAMGEEAYRGWGNCALCHNKLGRAPDLLALNVVKVSLERIADSKKGSNDTESPMPAVDQPPIELSGVEISAIIAYLQSKDGNTVTVVLPAKAATSTPAARKETTGRPEPALAQSPEEAIAKFGCSACHSILETNSPVGPNLNDVGARLSIDQIRGSIIAPNAVVAEGYPPIMPDLSEKMTVKELELIVGYLAKQTKAKP